MQICWYKEFQLHTWNTVATLQSSTVKQFSYFINYHLRRKKSVIFLVITSLLKREKTNPKNQQEISLLKIFESFLHAVTVSFADYMYIYIYTITYPVYVSFLKFRKCCGVSKTPLNSLILWKSNNYIPVWRDNKAVWMIMEKHFLHSVSSNPELYVHVYELCQIGD